MDSEIAIINIQITSLEIELAQLQLIVSKLTQDVMALYHELDSSDA